MSKFPASLICHVSSAFNGSMQALSFIYSLLARRRVPSQSSRPLFQSCGRSFTKTRDPGQHHFSVFRTRNQLPRRGFRTPSTKRTQARNFSVHLCEVE